MTTKTATMTKQEMLMLKQRYPRAEVRKTPPYALYQIKLSDCVITAYESGKVVFQGDGAEHHASGFQDVSKKKTTSSSTTIHKHRDMYPQCGSDEVGTGDYFGPITVCATCVKQEDVAYLKELGIQDSKAINDDVIRTLGPIIMEHLPYSLLILNNAKYNAIHPTNNMVAIKSKLHNQAYVHLRNKMNGLPAFCIIDQFVQSSSYYRYVQHEQDIVKDIHFETKAENKYISVACGSIIARYAFLKAFDAMCEQYDFQFLKGASSKVDQNIRDFVKQHGEEALYQVAKLHFANTKKALE